MIKLKNHLKNQTSPYLLQHAGHPVDWYPWCEEAFEKAEREDKPIFLSIGYSTCHWCHVMAHESFEDAEVAEELNRNFISIKVDREERPDIDSIYMEACVLFTGSGGVKFGRPKIPLPDNFMEVYRKWRGKELNITEAAKLCGLSKSTFHNRAVKLEHSFPEEGREILLQDVK